MKRGSKAAILTFLNTLNLVHKLHRLSRLSPAHIPSVVFSKFRRTLLTAVERSRASFEGPQPWDNPTAPKLRSINLIHPDALSPAFSEWFSSRFAGETAALMRDANDAVETTFDIFGSGRVDFRRYAEGRTLQLMSSSNTLFPVEERPKGLILWHYDMKSGIGWSSKTFYADIHFGKVAGVDVKVPWELSRCLHFVTMGQAYALSREERFAKSFVAQVEDWLAQNPLYFGVNWSSPMDIALRGVNWLAAWEFFRSSPSIPQEFEPRFAQALHEHGAHIRRHLEWGADVSTNHYLSNLVGLIYLGKALGQQEWTDFAGPEFAKEIIRQTYDDGFDYEASTSYHKLVMEMGLYSWLVSGKSLGQEFQQRFEKMFSLLSDITHNDRTVIIGDNDSGHVHVFGKRQDMDSSFLLTAGLALGFISKSGPLSAAASWIFGKRPFEVPAASSLRTPQSKGPCASGLLTLRGDDDLLVFSAQPNGTCGVGNHTHNDKLSFTLQVNGELFFADPGSGLYTAAPDLRNRLRSTSAHNTVEVDEKEQNRFDPRQLFSLSNDARVKVERYVPGQSLLASHDGYSRFRRKVFHRRGIDRSSEPLSWLIFDEITGVGHHIMKWRFLVAPGLDIEINGNKALLTGKNGMVELKSEEMTFHKEQQVFSPAYGVLMSAEVLVAEVRGRLPLRQNFRLTWSPREH